MADKEGIREKVRNALLGGYQSEKYPPEGDVDSADVYYTYRDKVCDEIDKFDPGKPKDGIPGYLAYNHGDKRMKTRTGRFLTKKLKLTDKLSETIIRGISDKINAELFAELDIRLDSGSKITDNYRHNVGSVSCMTGDSADCTKLYEDNPDRFQQLVMNFISDSARAIVVKLDNGQYFLDRVYCSSSHLRNKMQEYAIEHDWLWYNSGHIYLGDEGETHNYDMIVVSGLTFTQGEVPYMDTFYRYAIVNGKLDIFHTEINRSHDGNTDNTDGHLGESATCEWCGDNYHEDNVMYIEDLPICNSCLEDNFFHCGVCDKYHENDGAITISTHIRYNNCISVCGDCLDNYTECVECEGRFINSEIVQVDGVDDTCTKCAEQNAILCEDCDDWCSEATEVDGEAVCNKCLDVYLQCDNCDKYFTVYQIIENVDEYKCIECAGLGDCKGQSKFDFDDPSKTTEKPLTFDTITIEKHLQEGYLGFPPDCYQYGIERPTWNISEVCS